MVLRKNNSLLTINKMRLIVQNLLRNRNRVYFRDEIKFFILFFFVKSEAFTATDII